MTYVRLDRGFTRGYWSTSYVWPCAHTCTHGYCVKVRATWDEPCDHACQHFECANERKRREDEKDGPWDHACEHTDCNHVDCVDKRMRRGDETDEQAVHLAEWVHDMAVAPSGDTPPRTPTTPRYNLRARRT